jgi:signal transduction histidine kinase
MRKRLLLAILLTVAICSCALGIPLVFVSRTVIDSLAHNNLASQVQGIAKSLDDQLVGNQQISLADLKFQIPSGGYVVATINKRTYTYGNEIDNPLQESAVFGTTGTVVVSISGDDKNSVIKQVTALLIILMGLFIAVGALVARSVANRLAEPTKQLGDRAARLGAGDFRRESTRYGVPELDMVADALDTSAQELARLVQRERELVGDVSHQLRTRLTALQLRLDGLSTHDDPEVVHEIAAALEQSERLTKVLDELLDASRKARSVSAQPIDLTHELELIGEEWRETLRREGRSFRVRVADGLLARVTTTRFQEAIAVLLDNARQHGAGQVTLSARRSEGMVVVEVSDSGRGVPDELVQHIFERGVSGGGSTGLGLSLARALIDADGGRLELAANRPATFQVFLPVPRADDVLTTQWSPAGGPR